MVFILWGNPAKKKKAMIDTTKHKIVESAHPSPLSASRGFFGSKPYSKCNRLLKAMGKKEIDWQISESGKKRIKSTDDDAKEESDIEGADGVSSKDNTENKEDY